MTSDPPSGALPSVDLPLAGGCHCGALRYEVTAAPLDSGYCHCRICQRLSGAPAMVWASVRLGAFRYTKGRPRIYRSSDWGRREFCGDCGSQLAFRTAGPSATLDINLPTLDVPERLAPRRHTWVTSRLSWFRTADDLPEHPDDGPLSL
ncbi:Uncharacterized conserved protein [Tistlia consotensis]|uniref:Uncharacterized conserved protein n=1 Tax=Tistlia consotensis USBA 355 TaxID=560819 RepID=A0A1Y6C2E8_9PROT|nr:GFA family protein [Tistlia consotensis]SMF33135.1 Uncharacterized conserved protein [Tistlia consotensis USBA 355]SNR69448.1 Uncharacterized conserved protein [Tistlia consotensis]